MKVSITHHYKLIDGAHATYQAAYRIYNREETPFRVIGKQRRQFMFELCS